MLIPTSNSISSRSILSVLAGLFLYCSVNAQSVSITSPDGNLTFALSVEADKGGTMTYTVHYNSKSVVEPSLLGVVMKDLNGRNVPDWTEKIKIIDTQRSQGNDLWKPVYGEKSEIRDHFEEAVVNMTLQDHDQLALQLVVRAYNEGVAFRYQWPERRNSQNLWIESEKTHFRFPAETKAWFTPRAQATYELKPLNDWASASEMPLTLSLSNGLYACVAEAYMVNYARTRLSTVDGENNLLITDLSSEILETSPFSTPWRVIMVAETPGSLLENNHLILNLNPPNAIANAEWIKPGKVMREMSLSTEGVKKVVDFCAEHGLDYVHFDAGWYGHEYEVASDATTVTVDPRRNPKGDLDLKAAIAYAKSKGIGVTVYVNHRALERQLDEILPLYKAWGVDGVKYGFVHVGPHRWTTWLYDAVRKAADHELMVDIHDEFRPTGYSRTYPNLMTQEGILGNEGMPDATHNTILPFTRFVAGAADYTICYFEPRIKTTHAHQLALSVVYYSPLQWIFWYDKPGDYQGEKEIEFFGEVPTVWDETRVLSGEIGKYVVMARRKGNRWFVGAISNTEKRSVSVSFDFLDNGVYRATLYTDGREKSDKRTNVKINQQRFKRSDSLQLELKPSGGAAIILEPER